MTNQSDDLVAKMQQTYAEIVASDGGESELMTMLREAAAEITRLRAEVAKKDKEARLKLRELAARTSPKPEQQYQMVPVEPTSEMLRAAADDALAEDAAGVWKSMLAAAPKSPGLPDETASALEPFAKIADWFDSFEGDMLPDTDTLAYGGEHAKLTVGDFRHARAVLALIPPPPPARVRTNNEQT